MSTYLNVCYLHLYEVFCSYCALSKVTWQLWVAVCADIVVEWMSCTDSQGCYFEHLFLAKSPDEVCERGEREMEAYLLIVKKALATYCISEKNYLVYILKWNPIIFIMPMSSRMMYLAQLPFHNATPVISYIITIFTLGCPCYVWHVMTWMHVIHTCASSGSLRYPTDIVYLGIFRVAMVAHKVCSGIYKWLLQSALISYYVHVLP